MPLRILENTWGSAVLTTAPTAGSQAAPSGKPARRKIEKTRYESYLKLYEKASQVKAWELK